jgi:hypothetical protein
MPLIASCWLTANAQAGDPAVLQQKLSAQFKLTTTTADRTDIVTAGDVVELHKPGIVMFAATSPLPPTNTYKNGAIGQGFGTLMAMSNKDIAQRKFVPAEKCWVTGIQVQKDGVEIQLYSDPYNDIRFYGNLKILFPDKKAVPPVDSFLQTIAEVVAVATDSDQGAQGGQSDQGSPPSVFGTYLLRETGARLDLFQNGSFILMAAGGKASPGQFAVNGDTVALTYSATGRTASFKIQGDRLVADTGLAWVRQADAPAPASPAAPAPLPDIAPPPPPADTPPPTIAEGQTKDQVTAAFGQPTRIAKIGVKEIYYYKDMKVTFTNGKVSNIE